MYIGLDYQVGADMQKYLPNERMLERLGVFFAAFADSTRLKILSILAIGEICVSDIALLLKSNQTTISHQLRNLKNVGLVLHKRIGKVLYYSLANDVVNDILLKSVDYLVG